MYSFQKVIAFLKQDPSAKLVFTHYRVHKTLDKSTRSLLTLCIIKKYADDALQNFNEDEPIEKFQ